MRLTALRPSNLSAVRQFGPGLQHHQVTCDVRALWADQLADHRFRSSLLLTRRTAPPKPHREARRQTQDRASRDSQSMIIVRANHCFAFFQICQTAHQVIKIQYIKYLHTPVLQTSASILGFSQQLL